jgi:hypothetical protein
MIYLFEDRLDRMQNLLKDNLDNYSDIFKKGETFDKVNSDNVLDYLNSLNNMNVIIIHKSYKFPNKLTIDIIKEAAINLNKKIVVFSGGSGNAVINENEAVINSGRLYTNLKGFLESYSQSDSVNLYILIYGKTGYVKHQLKQFQNATLPKLLNYIEDESGKLVMRDLLTDLDTYLVSAEFDMERKYLENFIKAELREGSLPDRSKLQNLITNIIQGHENN